MICPLCGGLSEIYSRDRRRSYQKCQACELIFVPAEDHLSPTIERERYESHNNTSDDPRYVSYMQKTRDEILPYLTTSLLGLDFGCGKTELLSQLFGEKGVRIHSYDVFFRPDEAVWTKTYDFIVLSEVLEHLRDPVPTMLTLRKLMKPGGQFFLKTKFYPESADLFPNWYYKNDHTHVIFFNEASMRSLGRLLRGRVEFLPQDLTRIILE